MIRGNTLSLKEQIEEKFKNALVARNEVEVLLYRMLKSAIKNREIEVGRELLDEDVINLLEREAKQRRDSINQFKMGGRSDLVQKEEKELTIIESFLPEKLSESEIREFVRKKINETLKNKTGLDFGQTMGIIMKELKGKADGNLVQKIVREEIGA